MLSAGHLSVDINSGSLPALLPFFVSEYGMDYTSVAGLMFASSCFSSIIQPVFGHLADKGSRQWFMVLGILMAGLGLSLTGFVTDYWSIFAAVTCMGIGSAVPECEANEAEMKPGKPVLRNGALCRAGRWIRKRSTRSIISNMCLREMISSKRRLPMK